MVTEDFIQPRVEPSRGHLVPGGHRLHVSSEARLAKLLNVPATQRSFDCFKYKIYIIEIDDLD